MVVVICPRSWFFAGVLDACSTGICTIAQVSCQRLVAAAWYPLNPMRLSLCSAMLPRYAIECPIIHPPGNRPSEVSFSSL